MKMPKNWGSIARYYWGNELDKILDVYTLDELWDLLCESTNEFDRQEIFRMYNDTNYEVEMRKCGYLFL